MSSGEALLHQLNPQQQEAIRTVDKPLLVVAGPGTGKTRTLTTRLAYLIAVHNIAPENLLALTFTKRSSGEMGERLQNLVGDPARHICLGTFHSFCLQLLRAEGDRLQLPTRFGVCDRHDQIAILQEGLKHLGEKESSHALQRTLQELSQARNKNIHPQAEIEAQGLSGIYTVYQKTLREYGLLDFDDLLTLAVELLETFPNVRQRYQEKYPFISVDEYQDVNPLQYHLLRLLAGENPKLWAVGDADQAIYAFRGAQVENFLRFEKDFPKSRVVRLEQGYRSTPQIVAAANQVIAHNKARLPYTLRTDNPVGQPIDLISFPNEKAEASWIVREIEERVGGTSHYQHYKGTVTDTAMQREKSFRDFAVLFRLNAIGKPLKEALARSGIPYRVVGGTRFFDRKAVKELMAYLRIVRHPDDNVSLRRIINTPPRGIGSQTQAMLEAESEQRKLPLFQVMEHPQTLPAFQSESIVRFVSLLQDFRARLFEQPLSQFVSNLLESTGLERWRSEQDPRHENDFLLSRSLALQHDDIAMPEALDRFLSDAALSTESDDYDAGADAVTLMTLHAAKGLEFGDVFLCGMEENILPHTEEKLEEERRLFYVGLTRAREQAHL